jgi:hypothetical protein
LVFYAPVAVAAVAGQTAAAVGCVVAWVAPL